ncbi:class I SAM-dependent methyltransferase [Actinomadura opuntiae]|uniref:class I SAM-dependent methyltransferase n=1 Tax=Actinomadura sp. OS1-43 TaxID=604315 RepID=UPI00255B0CD7|nr:class I SAM-dependent methyltransferase [Actinomadura sp. OS1-43]MDL4820152.1 class I SAM-dependent methyltransferase [Actinomadura sp. OS1-43]
MGDNSLDRALEDAAENLSKDYRAYLRYSFKALEAIMLRLNSMLPSGDIIAIDIGSGTGEPARVLSTLDARIKIISTDMSTFMLKAHPASSTRVTARAESLPFRDNSVHLTTTVCAFHLMDSFQSLTEMHRVLRPGGIAAIVASEPEDLQSQIFHRFFPEFAALEAARHKSMTDIATLAETIGLTFTDHCKEHFTLQFSSYKEVIDIVRDKPFFGLQQLDGATYEHSLQNFSRMLEQSFPSGPVCSPSALTLGMFRKRSQ